MADSINNDSEGEMPIVYKIEAIKNLLIKVKLMRTVKPYYLDFDTANDPQIPLNI